MELIDYAHVIRRRWLSILICIFATMAVAFAVTQIQAPQYTATSRLFFGVQGAGSATDLAQGSTFTEKQMASYAEVATSPLVLDAVIQELNLPSTAATLATRVEASAQADTVILQIAVSDSEASRSAAVANAVAKQLTIVTGKLTPPSPDGSQPVRATALAQAQVPISPSSPILLQYLLYGLIAGAILGCSIAIARSLLDTRVRAESDVQALTSHSILGVVPFDASAPSHPIIMHDDPLAGRSEAVRRLRTNLQYVGVDSGSESIVVTSSISGEGKTTTALNLAVSLADNGLRVILIDADLRRPSIGDYMGLESQVGLTTVLIGRATHQEVVQHWQSSSLDILPAGQIPPNPSELLGSSAMATLLSDLSHSYDRIILDSPPLLPVTDAAVLSKIAGGTLVVVGADRLHRVQLRKALESLETVGANILGLVLNKISKRDGDRYGYGYGYSSDYKAEASIVTAASDTSAIPFISGDASEAHSVEHSGDGKTLAQTSYADSSNTAHRS